VGTSTYINNSLFISSLLSHFVEKKYFHGNMGTYKIGELPRVNGPRVTLVGEIPQNTHKNKKKGVVYKIT
jgi:hypothetical protein